MRSLGIGDGEGNVVASGQHRFTQGCQFLFVTPLFQPIDHLVFTRAMRIMQGINAGLAYEFLGNLQCIHGKGKWLSKDWLYSCTSER